MPPKTIKKKRKIKGEVDASKKRPREAATNTGPVTGVREISDATLSGAVKALLKRHKAQHSYIDTSSGDSGAANAKGPIRLVENDDKIHLQVSLVAPPAKPKLLPKRALLPHGLYHSPDGEVSVCLIVKDPVEELEGLLSPYVENSNSSNLKVIGLKELRLQYKTHERRRALAQAHEVFLCDARIAPSVPHLCGSWFTKAKKMPISVDLARDAQLKQALQFLYTPMFIPSGNSANIHIGNVRMKAEDIVDNVKAIAPRMQETFQKHEIAAVYLRTNQTPALPLYVAKPQELVVEGAHVEKDQELDMEMDRLMDEFEKDNAAAQDSTTVAE